MPQIPEQLRDLFTEPALAHVSYLNQKGQIVTFPMWADYDGEHVLISSPVGSRKGRSIRVRPQVAISIVSRDNRFHWLSISGRVVDIRPDENLEFIDRMAMKYTGSQYRVRTPREVFVIEIDRLSPSGQQLAEAQPRRS